MATSLRRGLTALLVVLAAAAFVAPAHAADPPSASTFSGTLTTSDGGPIDRPVLVRLFSIDPGGASYPTPQSSQLLTVGQTAFSLDVPVAGFYAIQARPAGGSRYLTSFHGGGETMPDSIGDPGLLFLPEGDASPRSGLDVELRRGFQVTGVVRGSNGQPLDDATVQASRWNASGAVEPIPSTSGFLTGSDGRYTATVAQGTALSLSVPDRRGYASWVLGGQTSTRDTTNSLTVDRDLEQDITLSPSWQGLGPAGRILRDETCLRHAVPGTAEIDGLRLDVSAKGLIVPEGSDDVSDPLDPESPVPALVPYWSDTARGLTWGVDGSTLCAIWTSSVDHMAYQATLTSNGDVTYRYGRIGENLYRAGGQAGWTEGTTDDAVQIVLPRSGDQGYADSSPTGLVSGPAGSTTPGRYRFTFTGFRGSGRSPAAAPIAPAAVTPDPARPGTTLTASTGAWDRDDLTFTYQWMHEWEPIADATTRTWAAPADAEPGDYQVRVVAHRAGHDLALQDTEFTLAAALDDPTNPDGGGSRRDGAAGSAQLPDTGGPPLGLLVAGVVSTLAGVTLLGGSAVVRREFS